MNRGRADHGAPLRSLAAVTPEPASCRCRDAIAITIYAAGHLATLHLCQWCGDSWDIDGAAAPRDAVHTLLPKSEALSAIWRRTACSEGTVEWGRSARG
jgi:hypothetical protein